MGERRRLPYAELQAPVGHTPRRPGDMRQRELERKLSRLDKQRGTPQYLVVTGVQGNKKAIQKNRKRRNRTCMIRKEKRREPRRGSR